MFYPKEHDILKLQKCIENVAEFKLQETATDQNYAIGWIASKFQNHS